MQALLDSYTKIEATKPLVAEIRFLHDSNNGNSGIVIPENTTSLLNARIEKLLSEISELQDNWDGDDAAAPKKETITNAKNIFWFLSSRGQAIYHVAPGPNGEIMMDIRNSNGTGSLEIVFYFGRTTLVYFPENGSPTQDAFSKEGFIKYLELLNKK